MVQLVFSDKVVSYDTFMNDLAARLASFLQQDRNEPEMISQRKAYSMFGRGNVDRWRKKGLIHPYKTWQGRIFHKKAKSTSAHRARLLRVVY